MIDQNVDLRHDFLLLWNWLTRPKERRAHSWNHNVVKPVHMARGDVVLPNQGSSGVPAHALSSIISLYFTHKLPGTLCLLNFTQKLKGIWYLLNFWHKLPGILHLLNFREGVKNLFTESVPKLFPLKKSVKVSTQHCIADYNEQWDYNLGKTCLDSLKMGLATGLATFFIQKWQVPWDLPLTWPAVPR